MEKNFTLKQIKKIANDIIKEVKKNNLEIALVVALSGELGSGKTTLTQEIARQLGIKENLVSPTFVIMKKYKTKDKKYKNLIHIDAYRLDSSKELMKLGWKELSQDKNNLIIVEWPERVPKCLDINAFKIILEHKDKETRIVKFWYN